MTIHDPKMGKGPVAPQSVTTGPIMGSRKVYAAPAGHPDIRIPFREIVLSDPAEAPVRVYDPSGPYTETDSGIDLLKGLPLVRDFLAALGVNIGLGFLLREGARAAVKLLPGWGNAISGGVAGAGTYAIGRAATAYFIHGVPLGETRRRFRLFRKRKPELPG